MPIYEYQCEHCGKTTDIKHGFKETPDATCPSCGGGPLKRLFSAAGIVFKGSGFYINDSRKSADAPKKSEPAAKSESTTGGSGGSGGTGGSGGSSNAAA